MTRPNFLIIGAYKGGTTSLYHYLNEHPQIFMSRIKETRFLTLVGHQTFPLTDLELRTSTWPVRTLKSYESLFHQAQPHHQAVGEASPSYLAFPRQSIQGIQKIVAHAKLIVLLRQPAARAYSSYLDLVRFGREEILDFQKALHLEKAGVPRQNDRGPRRNLIEGLYYQLLSPYFAAFPKEQIAVYLYEDWRSNTSILVQSACRFLAVDDDFEPQILKNYNPARWPKNKRWHQLVFHPHSPLPGRIKQWLNRFNLTTAPPLKSEIYNQLTDYYREDILQLQELIGRNLSPWLTHKPQS